MEGRKKYLKFKRFQMGSANTWENTMNSDESTHFERAFPSFCTCACQQCLMISVQNHAFSTILWLRCEEMHFENRQQYSAPAGALTMFLDVSFPSPLPHIASNTEEPAAQAGTIVN